MVDVHDVGIQAKNLMHTTYVLYHYATSMYSSVIPVCTIYSLVICLDSSRYIGAGHDIPYMQYLLAGVTVGRPKLVPRRPPLWP
jgi:hypothetical protein